MVSVEFSGNNPFISGFIHNPNNWYYEQTKQEIQ